MKISEVLQSFHSLPACDRLDLLSRMIRHCYPYELRFLGNVICDAAKEHHKNMTRLEVSANRVNHFSGFKDSGLTHEVCEKMCCALALVHADNSPVGETVFNILDSPMVLKLFEESSDLKMLEDYRLLYVMAVNHPALAFSRRLHLMYCYLQKLDRSFSEKRKYAFSSSFSSGSGEAWRSEGEAKLTIETIQDPSSDAYTTRCEVHSVYKRQADKRYAYMIEVEWSDGTRYTVRRTYGEFFSFQNKLLDLFPEEGGSKSKKQRVIPFLPGKKWIGKSNRELAEKRLPELAKYTRELMSLPEHVTRSSHVLDFFRPRPSDRTTEYPPHHKITTLYDLMESNRTKHPSAPPILLRGTTHSPTHSPIPIRASGSPIQRLGLTTDPPSSSSPSQTRSSQTLPTAPVQQVKAEESPLLRRPTWPSRKSAFTPVPPPAESASINSGGSTSSLSTAGTCHTPHPLATIPQQSPSSVDSGNTIEITGFASLSPAQPGPVSTSASNSTRSVLESTSEETVVHPVPNHISPFVIQSSTSSTGATEAGSYSLPALVQSQGGVTSAGTTISPHPSIRHRVNTYSHSSTPPSHPSHTGTGTMESGITAVASTSAVSSSPVPRSHSPAHRPPYTPHSSHPHTSTVITAAAALSSSPIVTTVAMKSPSTLTSPTPSSTPSPLLTSSTVTQSQAAMTTPSPPHSGTSTPKGAVPYSPSLNQFVQPYNLGLRQHYFGAVSPVGLYCPILYSSSPLHSPILSPKTPNTNRWHGSYNCVTTEYDSFVKWLKAHRLHKYASLFEGITFEQMCTLSEQQLKDKGMTTGAAKKLKLKMDELQRANFTGFRDMPASSGINRQPSTCSLPAAILMERGMTPSSSFEGLSPTDSTCSLDKPSSIRSVPFPSSTSDRHHRSKSESLGSETMASMDTAIVRAVPLNGDLNMGSLNSSGLGPSISETPVRTFDVPHRITSPTKSAYKRHSAPLQVSSVQTPHPLNHRDSPTLRAPMATTGGSGSEGSGVPSSSWADQAVSNEEAEMVNQPAWAQLPSQSEAKQSGCGTRQKDHQLHSTATATLVQSHTQTTPPSDVSIPYHQQPLVITSLPLPLPLPLSSPQMRLSAHTPPQAVQHISTPPASKKYSSDQYRYAHSHYQHHHHRDSPSPASSRPTSSGSEVKYGGVENGHPELLTPPQQIVLIPSQSGGTGLSSSGNMSNGVNWSGQVRPFLIPSSLPIVRTTPITMGVPTAYTNAALNGMTRTTSHVPPPHPQAVGGVRVPTATCAPFIGGVVSYPAGMTVQVSRSVQQPMCFNCGRKGHSGGTCPAESMEGNSSKSFHRQLENLTNSKPQHSSSKGPT